MKEECKLFFNWVKRQERNIILTQSKKDGAGELFECIQFSQKTIKTPLRDQLSVEFMSYWKNNFLS